MKREYSRAHGFLIGLTVALTAVLAALEYSFDAADYSADSPEMSEDALREIVMAAERNDERMASLVEKRDKPAKAQRFREVENAVEERDVEIAPTDETEEKAPSGGKTLEKPAEPVADNPDGKPLDFRVVEQLPEFPGGITELMKWLTANLRYPPEAQRGKIEGRVMVTFIINKDGSISDMGVSRPAHPLLDREALRVAGQMPAWKPGMDGGKPCRTLFAIPIVFKL